MARGTGRKTGALWTVFCLLMAWAITDGLLDYARDHDGINDPTPSPTCYLAEDGTSLCLEP